jgi:uncharacterized protein (UPF0128 family)
MPSKRPRITVYLTPEEHTQISEYATRAGLSLSTFAKRVCTGAAVPTLEHRQAVRDILKASADLGRLGGLLKLALSEKGEGGDKLALQRLLREIEAGQLQLKNAARNIR